MAKTITIISIIVLAYFGLWYMSIKESQNIVRTGETEIGTEETAETEPMIAEAELQTDSPMAIKNLRSREYLGGDFVIEEKLANGTNYQQMIVSYQSEGLKIFGLLTVPLSEKPAKGFPAIVFIHGYIPPKEYSTTGNYPTYQASLARSGFVTFKPDLRGHGNSEGDASGAHYSEKYVVDTLYAIEYLKKYEAVDPDRLGYWGHSNGGEIGLRVLAVSQDIKVASLWAGVVGSYLDMFETYNAKIGFMRGATSTELVRKNGLPSDNPDFWNQLDPYAFLNDITAPVQLQHGTADESVPIELSRRLKEELEKLNKPVEFFEYAGDDHNIGKNVSLAFQRTIDFYNNNLKIKAPNVQASPLDNPIERIRLKKFGDFITPENSPVSPERFSGYHTGVDFEVFPEEMNSAMIVRAMCEGKVLEKKWVNGYGGTLITDCVINEKPVTVLYGHLNLSSINAKQGDILTIGARIGNLGADMSEETDQERKHLHLSIHKGEAVNLKGYVSDESELEDWLNPCDYFCDKN